MRRECLHGKSRGAVDVAVAVDSTSLSYASPIEELGKARRLAQTLAMKMPAEAMLAELGKVSVVEDSHCRRCR